ncbi:SLC13 family permease [Terricaulis sp.]|uniref:SLC13 family permease n=1 Tax=Terricaulis sp. TaxID=2768686 RepID=UPI0037844078
MTIQQMLAFGLMGVTVACFVWGKLRYDLIALAALVAGALLGVIPVDQMFTGFANELIWIIASALLLSAAIARSGLIERWLGAILASLHSPSLQIPAFTAVTMVLSMVTKNIGALAIVMPVAMQHARKTNVAVSRLLMPMAFASLLGGLVTLVGTSPNVIVSSVRQSLLGEPFHMFDFTPVGLGVCAAGFIFLAIAPHFIRIERQPAPGVDAALAETRYVTEFELGEECAETVGELIEAGKNEARVVAVVTKSGRAPANKATKLRAGDHIIVEGEEDALERLAAACKLKLVGERHRDDAEPGDEIRTVEGVLRQESPLVGQSVAQARLHDRYGLSLLAVAREGRRTSQELRAMKLRAGDVLILKSEEERIGETLADLQILPLSEREVALGQKRFGYFPVLALAAAVIAVGLGWAPIVLAFSAAAIAVLLLRVMSMSEAYRAVEGPMLVLLAALIPISESISRTGGDVLIANALSHLLGPMPPFVAVAMLIVTGMAVTPFLNNAATVLIMAPIAGAIARALDVNPDPYLMAVAIGAACDFLTPIGHQCNTLVMGPGGYRFFDYWKLGLPLSIIVVLVATPLILIFWPVAPR